MNNMKSIKDILYKKILTLSRYNTLKNIVLNIKLKYNIGAYMFKNRIIEFNNIFLILFSIYKLIQLYHLNLHAFSLVMLKKILKMLNYNFFF